MSLASVLNKEKRVAPGAVSINAAMGACGARWQMALLLLFGMPSFKAQSCPKPQSVAA